MFLPDNKYTFTIKSTGDVTKQVFEGEFSSRIMLTVGEKRLLEAEKARYSTDLANPTEALIAYSNVLAELKVRIIDAPLWWKESSNGEGLLDENILLDVFNLMSEGVIEWMDQLNKKVEPVTKETKEGKTSSKNSQS